MEIQNKLPIRILHVVSTMDYGGVETLLMSIYRNIDRDKIQFDFLCHNRIESKFKDEIISLGGRMYMVHGPHHGGVFNYIKELKEFFSSHPEYSIVHAHMNRDNAFVLSQAKKAGVKCRVSHSHVAGGKYKPPYSIYVFFAKRINNVSLTHRLACSQAAGKDLFGKNKEFKVISNGINPDSFKFDLVKRNNIRQNLGIEKSDFVVGHVGRFDDAKNQAYVVEVFRHVLSSRINSKLLFIGDGPQREEISKLVCKFGIENNVIFAGQHSKLQGYYSAMDIFLFPSKYEGFGIVAVEAQCAGLPVLASDRIPYEVGVTENIDFFSLNKSVESWACKIMEINYDLNLRSKYSIIIKNSNYNIMNTVDYLSKFYFEQADR